MLRAIIFDFDGVLVDSEPIIMRLTQQVAAREGWTLSEADYYRELIHLDDRAMVERLGQLHGRTIDAAHRNELVEWKTRAYQEIIKDGLPPMPGAIEFLDEVSALFPLAIASGTSTSEVLSPTPPVEYLSIFGLEICERSMTSPESIISSVRIAVSCADILAK